MHLDIQPDDKAVVVVVVVVVVNTFAACTHMRAEF